MLLALFLMVLGLFCAGVILALWAMMPRGDGAAPRDETNARRGVANNGHVGGRGKGRLELFPLTEGSARVPRSRSHSR